MLITLCYAQDENKRLEDTEKKSRENLGYRLNDLVANMDYAMENKENPESQKPNIEIDDMYVLSLGQRDIMPDSNRFRQKFKSFLEQYEVRDNHFQSLLRTKECEVQFNIARFEQQKKDAEKQASNSRALNAQVSTFSQTETELRSQLNIYVEKFKQVCPPNSYYCKVLWMGILQYTLLWDVTQTPHSSLSTLMHKCTLFSKQNLTYFLKVEDTLNNSNDLFLTFRKEMEEMSKKTKRLEKENLTLTRKHDLTNRNILEMAEERTRQNKEMETLRKKSTTLENTIRLMQEQGRAPAGGQIPHDSGDSEYGDEDEEDDDYEEESQEGEEYDEETEDDQEIHAQYPNGSVAPTYGPIPPPPPAVQPQVNGRLSSAHSEVNGTSKKTLQT